MHAVDENKKQLDDLYGSINKNILPKWKYPEFRYLLNNIWLVLWIKEHNVFDEAVNRMKEDIWTFELINLIKDWKEIDIKKYLC